MPLTEKLTLESVELRAVSIPMRRPIVSKVGTYPEWPLLPIRLAQLALDVVPGHASGRSRRGPTGLPASAGRVPGPLRNQEGLPALPCGVLVAGRVPLPAVRRPGGL